MTILTDGIVRCHPTDKSNAPINVKPHLPPLGQWMGEGGALAQIWSRETAPWVGLLTRAYLERFLENLEIGPLWLQKPLI